MLQIKNLTLAFGHKQLINDACLQLYKGQTVGVVGRNGCGKTTLFKTILKKHQPEQGECQLSPSTLISYIEQEIDDTSLNLVEYVLTAHPMYQDQHQDLPEYYQLRPNAEKLLYSLGFSNQELMQPLSTFSGGWQMRANLAKALFIPSDVLLLDEPTNHLDIETVLWLEEWLKRYSGLALVISHDREFLDNVTSHTLHIANLSLNLYGGNYTNFEQAYAQQLQQQQQTASAMQTRIKHLQSFVDRFKAKASKARQAQSRMKMIAKLQYSPTFSQERDYQIEFLTPELNPDLLLTLTEVSVGYTNKPLLAKVNLQIYAGDRIGLLGRNGRGKTSLIKAILTGSSLTAGTVSFAQKIKIGYFAQQTVESLSAEDTPFSVISRAEPQLKQQAILNYLGRFGFSAGAVHQTIQHFSGGEKARLVLASIIIQKPNLLFLDEPTNHLDISMREELAAAIQDFAGAVILVSHDQFLLQSVVDDYYLIENQQLSCFNGSLEQYQAYLLSQETAAIQPRAKPVVAPSLKQISQLKQQIKRCETTLNQLQQQVEQLNYELNQASSQGNASQVVELHQQLQPLQHQLSQAEDSWLELHEKLSALESPT